jgi:DNA-binding MarR family transcriptional regulator
MKNREEFDLMKFEQDDTSELIYTLSTLQHNYIAHRLKSLQLNTLQARSLNYISLHPGTIQRSLSDYLGKKQATVTNILKLLEDRGYLLRKIQTDNERQKNLFLTMAGEKLVTDIQKIFIDLNTLINEPLAKSEHQDILNSLLKIKEHLNNINP